MNFKEKNKKVRDFLKKSDLMNEHHNARFEKLEATVFSPTSEVILKEIRKLGDDYKRLLRGGGVSQRGSTGEPGIKPQGERQRRGPKSEDKTPVVPASVSFPHH